ncbi:unnamed protein product [marine sediment metagenome]|uniref:Uncharacterized protein n=1 Tax=marine sediment metagenome TaxID=412755 RepID=X0TSN5_9ZZZZ
MTQDNILVLFADLSDEEKVVVLLRAIDIKVPHRTKEDCICLAMGYYREIGVVGGWINK